MLWNTGVSVTFTPVQMAAAKGPDPDQHHSGEKAYRKTSPHAAICGAAIKQEHTVKLWMSVACSLAPRLASDSGCW